MKLIELKTIEPCTIEPKEVFELFNARSATMEKARHFRCEVGVIPSQSDDSPSDGQGGV